MKILNFGNINNFEFNASIMQYVHAARLHLVKNNHGFFSLPK